MSRSHYVIPIIPIPTIVSMSMSNSLNRPSALSSLLTYCILEIFFGQSFSLCPNVRLKNNHHSSLNFFKYIPLLGRFVH